MKIGLCGVTFTSVNYGVAALAISQITLIDKCVKRIGVSAEYYIFSMDRQNDVTKLCNMIGINHVSVFQPARIKTGISGVLRLRKKISECDWVFDLTKGDSFSDIYGMKRFVLQDIEKRLAYKYSSLIISPQTIGPFYSKFAKREAIKALKKANAVFARDQRSKEYVESICYGVDVTATSDLAFYLPYERKMKLNLDGKTHIGINISGLLWNGGYTGKNEFGLICDYRKFTYKLIQELENDKFQVYLFAHVYMDGGDDDYEICEYLHSVFPDTVLIPRFSSPIDAKSFMSSLDLVIGARMHATIGAISAGTPVLPFSYSRKFEGLYESIGYDYVIEATKWSTERALSFARCNLDNINELSVMASKAVSKAKNMNVVYEDQIVKLLNMVKE